MKLSHLLLLTVACTGASSAYAATSLPPVLDNSVVYRAAMLQPATATDVITNQLTIRLDQIQMNLTNLQTKVDQQDVAINGLQQVQKAVNSNVDARLNNLAVKTSTPVATPVAVAVPVTAQISATGSELQRYQNAYALLRSSNADSAVVEFQAIIKDFPKGSYADNAQYWLGEAYLLKGQKQEAMQAFDQVVLVYPKSNKVPDALLKLGFVQLGLKNRAKAKEYLDYVIINYPKSNAAKLAINKATQAAL